MTNPIPSATPDPVVSQMQNYLKSTGYTPPTPSTGGNDWYSQIKQNSTIPNKLNSAPTPTNGGGDAGKEIADNLGNEFQSNFESAMNQTEKIPNFSNAIVTGGALAGKDLSAIVGEGFKQVFKGVSSLYNGAVPQNIKDSLSQAVSDQLKTPATQAGINAIKQGGDAYNNWKKANPEYADTLENFLNVGNLALTLVGASSATEAATKAPEAISDLATSAVEKGGNIIKGGVEGAKDAAGNIISKIPGVGGKSAEDVALQAITPSLKGKALVGAYTSDFGEGSTKAGLLTKQAAPISDETKRLAKSVGEYLTSSKDNIGNLQNLGKGMEETEASLNTLLENDKTVLDKEGIVSKLDEAKNNLPKEFISTNKQTGAQNLYNDVIDFMKDKIASAEEDIKGGRNARIEFDSAAKEQFPSAYNKNGFIDTTKPAGRAIKVARDIVNENLYNTAEQGSQMQQLIGKESDIFKATQVIGQKAAATEGKTALQIFMKQHPLLTRAIITGGTAIGGGEVLKHVVP